MRETPDNKIMVNLDLKTYQKPNSKNPNPKDFFLNESLKKKFKGAI
jgi:hypothetical protein